MNGIAELTGIQKQFLKNKKITNLKYFSKGKRGIIFTGIYRKKKVAIKVKRPSSRAMDTIKNEARVYPTLNKYKIGPKFLASLDNLLVYYFVEGQFIMDYFQKASKTKIKKILIDLLKQMRTLDKLMVNKEEMHHPYKHILITKKHEPVLIDFERVRATEDPKNLSQFIQFLTNSKLTESMKNKGFLIPRSILLDVVKDYKQAVKQQDTKTAKNAFKALVSLLELV